MQARKSVFKAREAHQHLIKRELSRIARNNRRDHARLHIEAQSLPQRLARDRDAAAETLHKPQGAHGFGQVGVAIVGQARASKIFDGTLPYGPPGFVTSMRSLNQ